MNPISILLHVGAIISAVKDLEQTISDAVHKGNVSADIKKVLEDVSNLVDSGIINIPGVSSDQLKEVIKSLEGVV